MSNVCESNERRSQSLEVETISRENSGAKSVQPDSGDTPNKRRHTIRTKNMKSAKFVGNNKSTSSPKSLGLFRKSSKKNQQANNKKIQSSNIVKSESLGGTNDLSGANDSLPIKTCVIDSNPHSNVADNVVLNTSIIPLAGEKPNARKKATNKVEQKTTTKKKNSKVSIRSHVLTDYYPVRRSSRKTKSLLQKEHDEHIIKAINSKCEDGLSVVEFKLKGRGVVAQKAFRKGSFVVEYAGDLVDWTEAKRREEEYAKDPSIGCYMYYFVFENTNYCVDATVESGRLGRLLNHSRKNPNCKTKLIRMPSSDGKLSVPRLVIVAKRDISINEELTYDYGDKDKETLQSHPWLKST